MTQLERKMWDFQCNKIELTDDAEEELVRQLKEERKRNKILSVNEYNNVVLYSDKHVKNSANYIDELVRKYIKYKIKYIQMKKKIESGIGTR